MTRSGYEILEHTADVGLQAWGPTLEECFQEAGRALLAIAVETAAVTPTVEESFSVTADGYEELLVAWLNELVFQFDADLFAPHDVVRIDALSKTALTATVVGERPRQPARHPWKLIVKAATYHDLEVARTGDLWRARVILDV